MGKDTTIETTNTIFF